MAKGGGMKQRGQYIVAVLSIGFLRLLPFSIAVWIGKQLGTLYYLLDRRHRKIATDNVALGFGKEKSDRQRRDIVIGSFQGLGQTFAEFVCLPKRAKRPNPDMEPWVAIDGFEHYLAAHKENRGVLLLTAHFGNWELIPYAFSLRGFPMHAVFRPLDNPYLNRWLRQLRERMGTTVLDKRVAAAQIIPLLRQGEMVAILLDQKTQDADAVFVDYFGRPAATHKGLALLALRTGAQVLPVFMIREGGRHRMIIEKGIQVTRTGVLSHDIAEATALFTRKIESYVRQYPNLWLWVHRRWKNSQQQSK